MELNRREFLRRSTTLAAALSVPPSLAGEVTTAYARLAVYPERRIREIPADFTGLSYETEELADPRFFSPQNVPLVGLLRRLGARGVLRVGGNSSEFALWMPGGAEPRALAAKSDGWKEPPSAVTPEAIQNLAGFVEAAGWSLIWGLNLGKGSAADAAEEAACVASGLASWVAPDTSGRTSTSFTRCSAACAKAGEPSLPCRAGSESPC
jgi:hypothetical protein